MVVPGRTIQITSIECLIKEFSVLERYYPSKNVQTKNGAKLKSGGIAAIVICSFIFIVIICVVLFFTVFRKMKSKTQDGDTQ